MTKKVLVTATNYSKLCAAGKKMLEDNGFEIIENTFGRPMTFEELQKYAPEADAVVAGVDTWNKDVFAFTPKLKVITRFGVGIDNINLKDAKDAGIYVTNAPGVNSNSVSELAIGLIIDMLRNAPGLNQSAKEGKWERFVGYDLQGKTIGLLGFGNIARNVAKKLSGFDVRVIAYDKYPNVDAARALNVELKYSVEDVLKESFVVSCHLPNIPETYHTMNKRTFAIMPEGSYFVNTSRGALVDEAALIDAVTSGHLGGAAVDVYEKEPVTADNPLLHTKGILTTPHTAAETFGTYHNTGILTAQAIIDTFKGIKPANVVNN